MQFSIGIRRHLRQFEDIVAEAAEKPGRFPLTGY